MAVLASLAKDHPQSRWSADAKALEVEVRQSSGQPVSPEEFSNEEIKLYALNGLAQTAPERALPMLNKILAGAGSPRMKERAVYVLAQVNSPEARQKLVQVAKGQGANPDMQLAAVRYLGTIRDSQSLPMLAEIYASTPDAAIKRQVLDAYAHHKDKARLLDAIQSEKDPGLRSAALSRLAGMRDAKALVDLARAEKDPKFKREIVRLLASMKSKEATDYLVEVLNQ
jgi:HEAT repeat protein